jgi:phosphoglycolate phosphatase
MAVHGMRAIKGIIFDKDGTLFDFQATWGAWSRGFLSEESGGDPALMHRLADALGYDLALNGFRPDSVVIAATTETVADRLLPLLPGVAKPDLLARMDGRAMTAPQVEVTPLVPLLTGLRARGLALGIATNDTEAPALAHLRHANIEGMFDFIAGFDSGHGGKPAPGQLLAFAAALHLNPADCVMVGDSLHDLHAARAAGMVAVGVLTGMADEATLDQSADVVLRSIADLPDWLDHQTG